MNENPKVFIGNKTELSESGYVYDGKRWSASTLIQWCKEKEYKVFKLPLAGVRLNHLPWDVDNLDEFIWHMQRVKDSSLDHPIILDSYGIICDGYHRVCKAILDGKTEINAIRIEEMPKYDGYLEKDE